MSVREDTAQKETPTWMLGVVPLVLVGVILALFVVINPLGGLRRSLPPVEELTFQRVLLHSQPHEMVVRVTNGGRDAVTIAQVRVDDAYWTYDIAPSHTISRLRSATLHIPYPWVEGESHKIILLTSTGIEFSHTIAVATETPATTPKTLGSFTLLGIFVGVIPVLMGLGFLPFLRRLERRWVHFFLALTAGLLVFIGAEALSEAFHIAGDVPGAFQGVGLIVLGVVAALATMYAADGWMRRKRGELSPLFVAALIAAGIGLHNLGEGLAIGAAYALGELGLTTFLVVGFMLHNVTEGIGIVSPLAQSRPGTKELIGLGLVAGAPAILGTWVGGLLYSPALAVFFLSVGAGAIAQVVWEIAKLMRKQAESLAVPLNAIGFAAGIVVMYVTGLAVAS